MGNRAGDQRPGAYGIERYPTLAWRCARALNPEAGWDDGIFRDHHDAIPDEIIISIQVRRFTFRRNHGAVADARIFVDDRAIDHAVAPDADGWL